MLKTADLVHKRQIPGSLAAEEVPWREWRTGMRAFTHGLRLAWPPTASEKWAEKAQGQVAPGRPLAVCAG